MGTSATTQKESYRVQFKYWLDLGKHDESDLADYCERLKSERSFTKTIRDALTLIRDLRAGRVDSLKAMFPAIVEMIRRDDPPTDKIPGGGEGRDLHGQLARIEQLLITGQTGSGLLNQAREAGRALLPAPRSLVEPFADNEPGIEISRAKTDPNAILNNFINGMGKLSMSDAPQAVGAPKPLAGASIKFAPPIDDDSEVINLFS